MNTKPFRLHPGHGHVVIANRNSGNLSILNGDTGVVVGTIELPMGTLGSAA